MKKMNKKLKKQKEKILKGNTQKSQISLLKSHRSSGITLIALVITIIVLLILAVVAIRAVQGDGILAKARKARDDYQEAQGNEEETLQNYTDYIAAQTGNNPRRWRTNNTNGRSTK